jgi:hypothetical protein
VSGRRALVSRWDGQAFASIRASRAGMTRVLLHWLQQSPSSGDAKGQGLFPIPENVENVSPHSTHTRASVATGAGAAAGDSTRAVMGLTLMQESRRRINRTMRRPTLARYNPQTGLRKVRFGAECRRRKSGKHGASGAERNRKEFSRSPVWQTGLQKVRFRR